jgi:hypothetical protein
MRVHENVAGSSRTIHAPEPRSQLTKTAIYLSRVHDVAAVQSVT